MDNAVALVQAYLRVNGCFTVAEFPVLLHLAGEARLNPAARSPLTLATALARFGCYGADEAPGIVDHLQGGR
jgi:hypothetical protein